MVLKSVWDETWALPEIGQRYNTGFHAVSVLLVFGSYAPNVRHERHEKWVS